MEPVKIRRSGNLIEVTPSCLSLLAETLTYTKRVQKGGKANDVEYQTVRLFQELNGSLLVPAGLLSLVAGLLKTAGLQLQYQDQRQLSPCTLDPDLTKLEPLRERQDEVLAAIMVNDMGIIEVPTGGGKSFLIRQICRIWSKCRIVICTYSKDIINMFHRELMELIPPDELGLVRTGCCQLGRRVTCVVDRSLMKLDLSEVDIFIYDEVHRAAAPCTRDAIYTCRNARMYGFSASPTGRADGADLETQAMFGPQIARLSYEEVQKTGSIVPMLVFKVACSDLPPITAMTSLSVERNGLWRNSYRNQRISDMVAWLGEHFDKDQQILISVKSVEHAVYLGRYLPDFTLVYGSMDADKRARWERDGLLQPGIHPLTSNAREQHRQDFRAGKLRRVIATSVWSTGVDFPSLNVVIRADGQGSTIQGTQIPGRATRSNDGKKAYGILIDFADEFHPTLGRRAESRFRLYRKKGWACETIDQQPSLYQQ